MEHQVTEIGSSSSDSSTHRGSNSEDASETSVRSRKQYSALSPGLEPRGGDGESLFPLVSTQPEPAREGPLLRELEIPEQPTFPGQLAVVKSDWWKKQMLVDRSLRVMAGTTSVFALAMLAVCFYELKPFLNRLNHSSTSVGWGDGESCSSVETKNTVVHLVINIAATMCLGMSNTYQQLVTALKYDEIRWTLKKFGDSRVGTNSPLAIRHKKTGKIRSWLAWILLITTSMPLHFLANSVVGTSYYMSPPQEVRYESFNASTYWNQYYGGYWRNSSSYNSSSYSNTIEDGSWNSSLGGCNSLYESSSICDPANGDSTTTVGTNSAIGCWTAFRTGSYTPRPEDIEFRMHTLSSPERNPPSQVIVQYDQELCKGLLNTSTDIRHVWSDFVDQPPDSSASWRSPPKSCEFGTSVLCAFRGAKDTSCRLNIRMQAAFILAGCLIIKAIYMVSVNLRARNHTKTHLLTFGDVVVSSAMDSGIRVHNESLLNAGDGHRHATSHKCHPHCTSKEESETGDETGHCQKVKCVKFNAIDRAADLPHPNTAIKYKKSLLANFGTPALTQTMTLFLCLMAMLAVSGYLAFSWVQTGESWETSCVTHGSSLRDDSLTCKMSKIQNQIFWLGSWGGFNTSGVLGTLPRDEISSEQTAFWISNGLQLIYSFLYLLLVYNITLISMEHDWAKFETGRHKLRCTIVSGSHFAQSYLLQLPRRVIIPLMCYSALFHWMLSQAVSTRETIWSDAKAGIETSQYEITVGSFPVWISTALMFVMAGTCWWAFAYRREGFIPQMYGSIRACCAATTRLDEFPEEGVQWGDIGEDGRFRIAGFSGRAVDKIVPGEIYCRRIVKHTAPGDSAQGSLIKMQLP